MSDASKIDPERFALSEECAKEPIHIPGAIQPCGSLLLLEEDTHRVLAASTTIARHLGVAAEDALGASAFELVDREWGKKLIDALYHRERRPDGYMRLDDRGLWLRAASSPQGVILELEEHSASPSLLEQGYRHVWQSLHRIEQVNTIELLAHSLAHEVRALTGYDRVCIYRFADDGSGEVIGEARAHGMTSFLGLKYPASDIPAQARRLYALQPLRIIHASSYEPSALVALPEVGDVDLSASILRSVSPVHLEYLRNMGVGASMSISLMRGDELWGLIACHHRAPRSMLPQHRIVCASLGRLFSLELRHVEEKLEQTAANQIKAVQVSYLDRTAQLGDAIEGAKACAEEFMGLFESDGMMIVSGDELHTLGALPAREHLVAFATWLRAHERADEDILVTDELSRHWPMARETGGLLAGVLAIPLSHSTQRWLVWTRREQVQLIQWGGDVSNKVSRDADTGRLRPRASFEAWQEEVRGRSMPFSKLEVESARELHGVFVQAMLRQFDKIHTLNRVLMRSNEDLDSFAYVASHDLKEPLRGIANYARFLQEDYGDSLDEEGAYLVETIRGLSKRMDALLDSLLHYSRVDRTELSMVPSDLDDVVDEVLDILHVTIEESGVEIRRPTPLGNVVCDRVRVGEVFNNLITNAIRYRERSREVCWVELGVEHVEGAQVFTVRDNGIGIAEEHLGTVFQMFKRLNHKDDFGDGTGAGLTIVQKIIERHEGVVEVTSELGAGTTFRFTLSAPSA